MCTYQTLKVELDGAAKGASGWFGVRPSVGVRPGAGVRLRPERALTAAGQPPA